MARLYTHAGAASINFWEEKTRLDASHLCYARHNRQSVPSRAKLPKENSGQTGASAGASAEKQ